MRSKPTAIHISKRLVFDEQIKKAYPLVEGSYTSGDFDGYSIENKMKKMGFQVYRSTGVAFIGKRMVVKIGYLTSDIPDSKNIVPTNIYSSTSLEDLSDGGWHEYVIMVQPRVVMNPRTPEKLTELDKFHRHMMGMCVDLHCENIGLYRGRPVMFDW